MASTQYHRNRFTEDALATATGPRIVVMAYDRLERDLTGALAAVEAHEVSTAHELLCHAQDLVHELLAMLDVERWEHAPALAAIYRYVIELLTRANARKRAELIVEARSLLADLGDAFRTAAATSAGGAAAGESGTTTAPIPRDDPDGRRPISLRA